MIEVFLQHKSCRWRQNISGDLAAPNAIFKSKKLSISQHLRVSHLVQLNSNQNMKRTGGRIRRVCDKNELFQFFYKIQSGDF